MDADKLHKATAAVRSLFADEEIPEDFTYEGQTFEERCEAWVLHALDELKDELDTFDEECLEDSDEEDEEDEEY